MERETVHRLLASEERRTVLRYLAGCEGTATVPELARQVTDSTESEAEGGRGDTHLRLHHVDLPKLAEAGVVEYDRDVESVRLTDNGQQLEAVRREIAKIFDEND